MAALVLLKLARIMSIDRMLLIKKNHNKLVVKVLRFAVAIVKFLTISSALDLFIFAFDEKVRRKNEVEWRDFSLYIMCVCFKFSFAVHVSLC